MPWDDLLRTYVTDGAVDYKRWQTEAADVLDGWLAKVSTVNVEQLETAEGIVFLINLYNAVVVQQVLRQYPIESVRPEIGGLVPNWISFLSFFKKKVYCLNGRDVSLDNIEHDILRKRYAEPRIHFALVCAAKSCPPLRSGAYFPQQVFEQLEEGAQQFVNNPEKVRYEATQNVLFCSKIFDWYEKDFLTQANSVADYVQRYWQGSEFSPGVSVEYLPYSWALNEQ